jgi:protein O-mannosyl-transferase
MVLKSSPGTAGPASLREVWIVLAVIVTATWIAYRPVSDAGFVNWDDNHHVFENTQLAKPMRETARYYFGPHHVIGNYIPLTMMMYSFEYKIAGMRPSFYHKVNLAIHIVNAMLVFWLILLLAGDISAAGFVAALFALHPMHVESVAWISELKDLLYTHAFLAGLIWYWHFLQKEKVSHLVMTFVCFVISVLAKPAAVVFPLFLVLMDYYHSAKLPGRRSWLQKIPFFALAVIFSIVAIRMQEEGGLLVIEHSPGYRLLFAAHSLVDYAVKAVVPYKLSLFYPYPDVSQLPWTYYAAPFVIAIVCYLIYRNRRNRTVVFGTLFFVLPLLPVLQIIPAGYAIKADRYTYLPYVGLFFIVSMALKRWSGDTRTGSGRRIALTVLMAAVCLICASATYSRAKVWKNDDSLATDLLKKNPNDPVILNNKGYVLYEQKRYEEAIPLYRHAIEKDRTYVRAYINLANAYISLNDGANAMAVADTALAHAPGDFYLMMLKAYLESARGERRAAISWYERAVKVRPASHDLYERLASEYYEVKEYAKSLAMLEACLKLEPSNYLTLNSKGYVLLLLKRYSEAMSCFEASIRIKPDYKIALENIEDCRKAMEAEKGPQ